MYNCIIQSKKLKHYIINKRVLWGQLSTSPKQIQEKKIEKRNMNIECTGVTFINLLVKLTLPTYGAIT